MDDELRRLAAEDDPIGPVRLDTPSTVWLRASLLTEGMDDLSSSFTPTPTIIGGIIVIAQ